MIESLRARPARAGMARLTVAALLIACVTGGARSGKSRFAEALAARSGLDVVYIATMEPHDDDELPDLLDAQGSLPNPATVPIRDTFRELLEEVRDDADDTGCEGMHTVDSRIIEKIERALAGP